MFAHILITLGLVAIIVGAAGMVITTVENIKLNDNSVQNKLNTIYTGFIFFAGCLVAAAGGFLLM